MQINNTLLSIQQQAATAGNQYKSTAASELQKSMNNKLEASSSSISFLDNNYNEQNSRSPIPSRPKLYAMHSSDTSRLPTLERLGNPMLTTKRSKLITESVTFNNSTFGDYFTNNSNMTKISGSGSQSDVMSVHSTTGSSKSNHRRTKSNLIKKRNSPSTPTEIFAKNLSEAVLDIDDSYDNGYVYHTNDNMYAPLLIPLEIVLKVTLNRGLM
ncbi:MAG: hypothetical protein EXX96DRAFT_58040 [Benjaminiella poitrasii]|nr:MAG: hypothetical protein EXX96DRAFT_58040 [Benjaminiella poitrasii]